MTAEDRTIIDATMLGYMAGLADRQNGNPFAYVQPEAWAYQHGFEQGSLHRARSTVRDEPITKVQHLAPFVWLKKQPYLIPRLIEHMAKMKRKRLEESMGITSSAYQQRYD